MNGALFSDKDRKIFQVLINHHLEPLENLVSLFGASSPSSLRRQIQAFSEKYRCFIRTHVLHWEQLNLQSFFLLTDQPIIHPYSIRRYKIMGSSVMYLTQFVMPPSKLSLDSPGCYPITRIYRPSNNMQLLYNEARTLSSNDEWLLNLKEVMVDQGLGDIVYQQEVETHTPISIDSSFLTQLSKLYLHDELGRLSIYKQIEFIKKYQTLLATYLELELPDMVNYILILDKTKTPHLFAGGFIGRFPLTELYETPNALICRFQTPDFNYAKINLMLFTNLLDICVPYLWVLLEDQRSFQLLDQWTGDRWLDFEPTPLFHKILNKD